MPLQYSEMVLKYFNLILSIELVGTKVWTTLCTPRKINLRFVCTSVFIKDQARPKSKKAHSNERAV